MRLGRYRLIRQLAVGGMAEVYLATATGIEGFEKLVVIKRILPQHAQNPRFVSMFLDEARLAATLHHPNVVQVFDIGSEAGLYYFAMEYAHGEDVRSILARAQKRGVAVPLGVAIAIALDVCRGLHYAHERRDGKGHSLEIVHRDVTPSNAIVTYDGVTKVLDFGVAKSTTNQTETNAGSLKGKIGYLSPEQCLGEKIDRRSDVFALGILLYELTTGARLFRGNSDLAILQAIAHKDAPLPSTRVDDYSPQLEQIVMRALARSRDARYPTAMAVQRDLEELARDQRLATSSIDVADFVVSLFPRAPSLAGVKTPTPQPLGRARSRSVDEPSVRVTDYLEPDDSLDGEPAAEIADQLEPLALGSSPLRTVVTPFALFDPEPLGLAARGTPAEPLPVSAVPQRLAGIIAAFALALVAGVIVAWRVQVASPGTDTPPELAPPPMQVVAPAPAPVATTAPPEPAPVPVAQPAPAEAEPSLDEVLFEPDVIKRKKHKPRPRGWDSNSPLPPPPTK